MELGRDPDLAAILEYLSPQGIAGVAADAPAWVDDEEDE
jgi:hypothetical protein